jgi:hypothetical protein
MLKETISKTVLERREKMVKIERRKALFKNILEEQK